MVSSAKTSAQFQFNFKASVANHFAIPRLTNRWLSCLAESSLVDPVSYLRVAFYSRASTVLPNLASKYAEAQTESPLRLDDPLAPQSIFPAYVQCTRMRFKR